MAQPLAGSSIATINRFGRLVVRVAMEWTLASRVQRCKHERELFLEFLFLPLETTCILLCPVRWVKAARRRLSVSLESLRRAFHHVLRLFSVAIIERTEGTGTRWTVGAEPTEKVSRGLPSTSTNPGQRLLRGIDDPGQKYEAKDRKGRRLAEGAAGCIWGCSPESLARPEGQT